MGRRVSFFVFGLVLVLIGAAAVLGLSAKRNILSRMEVEGASGLSNLSGEFIEGETEAWFNGENVTSLLASVGDSGGKAKQVLGAVADEKWVEVDLSEQKLIAHGGSGIYMETPVSSGKWAPTPTGEFRVWIKLRYTKMEGGVKGTGTYYYLPNVPYVMFFGNDKVPGWRGYSLHGTYWHNNFGNPMSHGCVNLPTPAAEKLYYWINPVLLDGVKSVRSTEENPGTRILIHE